MQMDQMQAISSVSFSGVFALRDGVSETEFLPRLHTFFQHFIEWALPPATALCAARRWMVLAKHYRLSRIEVNSSIQTWSGSMRRMNTSNNMVNGYTRC